MPQTPIGPSVNTTPHTSTPTIQTPLQSPCITLSDVSYPSNTDPPDLFSPATPTTPSPLVFDFSSLTTPTPSTRPVTAIKRSKSIHPLQTATKRVKSNVCQTLTRSASKNVLNTQPGDDLAMDLPTEGHADLVVRSFSLTDTPLLITALADQGQHYLVGP